METERAVELYGKHLEPGCSYTPPLIQRVERVLKEGGLRWGSSAEEEG